MRLEEQGTFRSENPRDNMALPKTKMNFQQMLEDAIVNDGGSNSKVQSKSKKDSTSQKFLKRKDKYDPKASLKSNKGLSSKNIEKKRIFKSNNRAISDNDASCEEDAMHSDSAMNKSTFKNVARKSFIQTEATPKHTNRTVLPPSLS